MLRLLLLSIALLSTCTGMIRIKLRDPYDENFQQVIVNFGVNFNKYLMQHADHAENVLFSPIGVYASLAVTYLAANGQTKDEIATVMGLPKDSEISHKLHENLGSIFKILQNDANANVTFANGIFLQNGYQLKSAFQHQLQSYYNNQVVDVDFNSNDVTDIVNKWFAEHTHDKIEQYFEETISPDTKLLLANALCFDSNWNHAFPAESTQQESFQTENGQRQSINMMRITDTLSYYHNQQYRYESVGIPYKQNEYQMYLILPEQGQSLHSLVDVFTYDHIQQIVSNSAPTVVDIKMPQMKLKTDDKIKEILQQLGVNQLFDSPDLSNMIGQSNLRVSQVDYALEIQIDEQGTDVCAGTTQEYKIHQQRTVADAEKQFYLQKPFMFFVYHKATKCVLFYGNIRHLSQ